MVPIIQVIINSLACTSRRLRTKHRPKCGFVAGLMACTLAFTTSDVSKKISGKNNTKYRNDVRMLRQDQILEVKGCVMKRLLAAVAVVVAVIGSGALAADPEHVKKLKETNRCWGCKLESADLMEVRLVGAKLNKANLARATLANSDLYRADLSNASLISSNLTEADLTGTDFNQADLTEANLTRADLTEASFLGTILHKANLSSATLRKTSLIGADLSNANLSGANLSGANLAGANLLGASLVKVYMIGAILCNTTMPDGSVIYSGC